MSRTFFDLFPTPSLLTMYPVGLDIDDQGIRLIQFEHGAHGVEIKRSDERAFSQGTMRDGEVIKREEVLSVLTTLKKEFELGAVNVALPEEQAFFFNTTVEFVEKDNLRDAVEFTIEENVPLTLAEAVFEYAVLEEENGKAKVLVTVFPRRVVEKFLEIFDEVGLTVLHLTTRSQALAGAVVGEDSKETHLVLDVGKTKMGLYVIYQGLSNFTSVVHVPLEALPRVGAIVVELKKVIAYWQNHTEETKAPHITNIVLSGASIDDDLLETIQKEIDIPSGRAKVWQNIFDLHAYVPSIPANEAPRFASAVGLASLGEI
jgi:Tfp pilus assembly PilM family ATPase